MPSRRKLERARAFAADAGLQFGADHIAHTMYSLEAAQAGARPVSSARASPAIVCASDPMALGAIRAVRRAGLKVPDDVSVVGFDDSALMNCTDPPLTTVRQPIDAMGRMVIELLIAQIAGTPFPTTSCSSSPSWSFAARRVRCERLIPPDPALARDRHGASLPIAHVAAAVHR